MEGNMVRQALYNTFFNKMEFKCYKKKANFFLLII